MRPFLRAPKKNNSIERPLPAPESRLGPDVDRGLELLVPLGAPAGREAREVPLRPCGARVLEVLRLVLVGPAVGVQGSGFRVQGSGFRVQGAGLRAQGSCRPRATTPVSLMDRGGETLQRGLVKPANEP